MATKAIDDVFAKAVEYAKAVGLGPPPAPPKEIGSGAQAEHYVLALREWAKPLNTRPLARLWRWLWQTTNHAALGAVVATLLTVIVGYMLFKYARFSITDFQFHKAATP
jgi:hypothetical protein